MPRMASGGPWGTLDHAEAARTDCLVKTARVLTAVARWMADLESMVGESWPRDVGWVEGWMGGRCRRWASRCLWVEVNGWRWVV